MIDWFGALSLEQQIYAGIALVSSAVVLVQLVGTMTGLGAEDLLDTELDSDGGDADGVALLSTRTAAAFFLGFGWTGLLMAKDATGVGPVLQASLVGLLFGYAVFRLMGFLHGLRHSGSLDYANALGEIGSVYLEVHPELAPGGQVEVKVQGRLRVVQALTRAAGPLSKGTRVEVVDLLDPTTLVVAPLDDEATEE